MVQSHEFVPWKVNFEKHKIHNTLKLFLQQPIRTQTLDRYN